MTDPTGTTIGKRWKCNLNVFKEGVPALWVISEYIADPKGEPGMLGIKHRRAEVGPGESGARGLEGSSTGKPSPRSSQIGDVTSGGSATADPSNPAPSAPLTDSERTEYSRLADLYEQYALVADDPSQEREFRTVTCALRLAASRPAVVSMASVSAALRFVGYEHIADDNVECGAIAAALNAEARPAVSAETLAELKMRLALALLELGRVPDPRFANLRPVDVRDIASVATPFDASRARQQLTEAEVEQIVAAILNGEGA
jgi:hypothetical protein